MLDTATVKHACCFIRRISESVYILVIQNIDCVHGATTGAFVYDLDGNNVECVCHCPEAQGKEQTN